MEDLINDLERVARTHQDDFLKALIETLPEVNDNETRYVLSILQGNLNRKSCAWHFREMVKHTTDFSHLDRILGKFHPAERKKLDGLGDASGRTVSIVRIHLPGHYYSYFRIL